MFNADLSGSPVETHDPRFDTITDHPVTLERLANGCRWAEGSAYFPAGRYLVWSDIPTTRRCAGEFDRLLRAEQTAETGACPTCSAPHSRGAFCWQCGATLIEPFTR